MNLMESLISAKLGGSGGGGSVTPGTLVIVSGEMTDEQAAQFRGNIGAITAADVGTVFAIRGSVSTVADLPATGNAVGDVYYVEAVSAGYIWITSTAHPTGYWEELGEPIDLSAYELKPTQEYPVGSSVTIAPAANTIYECGELTSLAISNPPTTGKYSIIFYSGATPTTTVGIENFAAEANKRYKITVEDNYATYDSWPYTPT